METSDTEKDWSFEVVNLMDTGSYEQAAKVAMAAYLQNRQVETLFQILNALHRAERFDDLFVFLDKARKLDGDNADLNLLHASALGMNAEYPKAKEILEKMNKADPGQVRVLSRLVQVCEQLRDYNGASGYLRAVLRFVKDNEKLNEKSELIMKLWVFGR